MTESSPVSLYTRISLPENKTGSTGQLVQSTQARVISLIDGSDLGPHKSGELLVRGPQVKSYCTDIFILKLSNLTINLISGNGRIS